jgi:hypothetical protein
MACLVPPQTSQKRGDETKDNMNFKYFIMLTNPQPLNKISFFDRIKDLYSRKALGGLKGPPPGPYRSPFLKKRIINPSITKAIPDLSSYYEHDQPLELISLIEDGFDSDEEKVEEEKKSITLKLAIDTEYLVNKITGKFFNEFLPGLDTETEGGQG